MRGNVKEVIDYLTENELSLQSLATLRLLERMPFSSGMACSMSHEYKTKDVKFSALLMGDYAPNQLIGLGFFVLGNQNANRQSATIIEIGNVAQGPSLKLKTRLGSHYKDFKMLQSDGIRAMTSDDLRALTHENHLHLKISPPQAPTFTRRVMPLATTQALNVPNVSIGIFVRFAQNFSPIPYGLSAESINIPRPAASAIRGRPSASPSSLPVPSPAGPSGLQRLGGPLSPPLSMGKAIMLAQSHLAAPDRSPKPVAASSLEGAASLPNGAAAELPVVPVSPVTPIVQAPVEVTSANQPAQSAQVVPAAQGPQPMAEQTPVHERKFLGLFSIPSFSFFSSSPSSNPAPAPSPPAPTPAPASSSVAPKPL